MKNKAAKAQVLNALDKPQFGYLSALYKSFYSGSFYVDAGKRWKGYGLLYLLLLCFIITFPITLKTIKQYEKRFNEQIIQPLALLPTITVKNGIASMDKPMPYLVKNAKNEVVAVVDTTGKTQTLDSKYPKQSILVKQDAIVLRIPDYISFRLGNSEPMAGAVPLVSPLNGINGTFSGKAYLAKERIQSLLWLSSWMSYPFIVLICYFFSLILFLVTGLLAQFYVRVFFSFFLTYRKACLLLILSSTPVLFLSALLLAFDVLFAGEGIVLLAVLTLYFSFAVLALKRDSQHLIRTSPNK